MYSEDLRLERTMLAVFTAGLRNEVRIIVEHDNIIETIEGVILHQRGKGMQMRLRLALST